MSILNFSQLNNTQKNWPVNVSQSTLTINNFIWPSEKEIERALVLCICYLQITSFCSKILSILYQWLTCQTWFDYCSHLVLCSTSTLPVTGWSESLKTVALPALSLSWHLKLQQNLLWKVQQYYLNPNSPKGSSIKDCFPGSCALALCHFGKLHVGSFCLNELRSGTSLSIGIFMCYVLCKQYSCLHVALHLTNQGKSELFLCNIIFIFKRLLIFSQNQRIIEWHELEGTLKKSDFSFPVMDRAATHQIRLPRASSKLILNISRDAASTTSLDSSFQCLTTLCI